MNTDYQGTYWDAKDLKDLFKLARTTNDWDAIATALKRSPSACKARYMMLRVGMMMSKGQGTETLKEFSKRMNY